LLPLPDDVAMETAGDVLEADRARHRHRRQPAPADGSRRAVYRGDRPRPAAEDLRRDRALRGAAVAHLVGTLRVVARMTDRAAVERVDRARGVDAVAALGHVTRSGRWPTDDSPIDGRHVRAPAGAV